MLTSGLATPLPLQLALVARSRHQRLGNTECDPQNLGPGCSGASGADM
jgi:hypothetical protein